MFCLGAALVLDLACQRGQTSAPSPISNAAASVPAAVAPPAEPVVTRASAPEPVRITLPKAPNTPVRRTRRPFTSKQLAELSALDFQDFDRQERATTDLAVEVQHTTRTRPKLGVTVRIDTCPMILAVGAARSPRARAVERAAPVPADPRACVPMRLALWEPRRDELKQFLSADLAARSDTRFYVGADRIAGTTAIYTYQLGHLFALDDRNQTVAQSSNAYVLYYNDGVNRIRVMASYLDEPVATREQLIALAPPRELEKMAAAFMSFYLHQWR